MHDDTTRRKRLTFRSWHLGTRELDLLLGTFADRHLAECDAAMLDQYERLLEMPDPDLYNWIIGTHPAPDDLEGPLLDRLRAFRLHDGLKQG